MEPRSDRVTARFDARRIMLLGAVGGMLAGMMMALTEMIYGWASGAHTAWDAPMAIWAWIVGLNHFGQPANHIGPIVRASEASSNRQRAQRRRCLASRRRVGSAKSPSR